MAVMTLSTQEERLAYIKGIPAEVSPVCWVLCLSTRGAGGERVMIARRESEFDMDIRTYSEEGG